MSPEAGWLLVDQIVPRLKAVIPKTVSCIGSEDAQELVQDSIALAARMLHNTEQAAKKVTPGNIAYYTIQHIKSGRRSTGSSVVDVLGSGTQLNRKTRLTSLEDVAAIDEETGGEIFFHDVLSNNDQEDPGTKAARKLGWETFMAGLSARDQAVIGFLIEGRTKSSMARQLGVCPSTIQHRKNRIAIKIVRFMGEDTLIQIQRRLNWKDDLTATKEKMACKYERCGK